MAEVIQIASLEIDIDVVLKESARLKKSIDELKKANKELDQSTEEGRKQFVKNSAELKNLNKSYRDNQKTAAALLDVNKDLARALSTENKGVTELRNSRRQLIEIVNQLNGETKEEIALANKLNTAIDEQTAAIREGSSEFIEGKDSIGEYANGIRDAVGGLNPFRNGLKGSIAALKQLTKAAIAFIATPLGATIAALAGIGLIAKQFLDYNNTVRESIELTQQLTNTTGELADSIRLRSQAITNIFKTGFEDNIKSARTLVNEFGISFEKAFDVIEKGLISGGAANDDFLNQIREYPTFFAKAGFSAENFVNIINTGADLSIFKDKFPDAIKEATIALSEQTPAARDALNNAFGSEFTDELFGNITDGSITVKQALLEIGKASEEVQLNVQQQAQLTADLFKGSGEDAGGVLKIFKALNIALNEENKELTELETALERQIELQKELLIAKDEALKSDTIIGLRREFNNFGTFLQTQFFKILNFLGGAFNRFTDNALAGISSVIAFVNNITKGVRAATSAAQAAFDSTIKLQQSRREANIEIVKQQQAEELAAQKSAAALKLSEEEAKKNAAEAKKRTAEAKKRAEERISDAETELQIFQSQNRIRLNTAIAAREEERDKELEIQAQRLKAGIDNETENKLALLQIENEFQENKKAIQDAELERIETFENEKRELENELALLKEEDKLIKAEIALQQEFDDQIRALEQLEINEAQKTELLALLEEQRVNLLQGIRDDAGKKQTAAEKKLSDQIVKNKLDQLANEERIASDVIGIAQSVFGENKALSSAATLIETFIGAQRTYTALAANPITAAIAATAVVVQGLARVAKINSVSFAEGGILDNPNLPGTTTSDSIPARLSKGESVINAKSTSMFRPLLSAVNHAGGGRRFQTGGISGIGNIASQITSAAADTPLIDVEEFTQVIVAAVEAIPPSKVSVEEINTVETRVAVIEEGATV